MKKLVLILFCFSVLGITISFAQNNSKQSFYVSSSMGNDSNDGLTVETPKRTISSISKKNNVIINLKKGDCFYESLRGYKNSTIQSYGSGAKPIICGFKVLNNVSTSVWKYNRTYKAWYIDLTVNKNFKGFGVGSTDTRINNVGAIYDAKNDKIYGHKVSSLKKLENDGDFFQTELFRSSDITRSTFARLYFKSKVNPSKLGYLCFSMADNGITDISNCLIKDIAIIGFSQHGICECSNSRIENCNIDIIGGSVQIGTPKWVRYGNGIEIWSPLSGNTITGCLISRTYDCGSTIQASGVINGDSKNNHFVSNYFYKCRQAFEFFLNPSDGYKSKYVNCSFESNLIYVCRENGFSSPEWRDAAFLSYDVVAKDISIKNNVVFGSNYYCGYVYPKGLTNNEVYIYSDQYINHAHDKTNQPIVWSKNTNDLKTYTRRNTTDKSKIQIITRGSARDLELQEKFEKQIGWTQLYTYGYVVNLIR